VLPSGVAVRLKIDMQKNFLVVGLWCFLALPAAAQLSSDTLHIDLRGVLEQTLSMSPDVRAAQSESAWASARYDLARSSRILPEVTATSAFAVVPGIENPNSTPRDQLYLDPAVRNDYSNLRPYAQTEISLIQPVYTWGALGGTIKAAGAGSDLEDARVQEKMAIASLRAASLYYGVLLANELYRLTDRAGEVVSMAMREINRLLEEGDPEVDDADRYQVLLTEQEYERRVVQVSQERQTAHSALRRQLLAADSIIIVPVRDTLEPLTFILENLATYQQKALMYRPEILQAQAGLVATDALIGVARADYYPQAVFGLTLSASGASNRYRQPNPYISDGFRRASARTGFGLIQKLNFRQTRARVAQAQAQHTSAGHLAVAAEQLVLAEVEQAWRRVITERAALAAEDSSLAISKEWLRVEQINFDLDLGDTENLVKAVQTNLALEARYYEAVRRYNMAILELLAAAGVLIHEMNAFIE